MDLILQTPMRILKTMRKVIIPYIVEKKTRELLCLKVSSMKMKKLPKSAWKIFRSLVEMRRQEIENR
jgi:hypothetical protein